MGCIPLQAASSSYSNCTQALNLGSKFHNQMLNRSLQNLNAKDNSTVFITLDLYNAFFSALNKFTAHAPGMFIYTYMIHWASWDRNNIWNCSRKFGIEAMLWGKRDGEILLWKCGWEWGKAVHYLWQSKFVILLGRTPSFSEWLAFNFLLSTIFPSQAHYLVITFLNHIHILKLHVNLGEFN